MLGHKTYEPYWNDVPIRIIEPEKHWGFSTPWLNCYKLSRNPWTSRVKILTVRATVDGTVISGLTWMIYRPISRNDEHIGVRCIAVLYVCSSTSHCYDCYRLIINASTRPTYLWLRQSRNSDSWSTPPPFSPMSGCWDLVIALRFWHREWLMTIRNLTANAIFIWTLNRCFHSEDLHQILWFRAALLWKIFYCVSYAV